MSDSGGVATRRGQRQRGEGRRAQRAVSMARAKAALEGLRAEGSLATATIVDVRSAQSVLDIDGSREVPIASIGKVVALVEAAAVLMPGPTATGVVGSDPHLDRRSSEQVADSGIWQWLETDSLSLADAAALVGAVSDNLATNVLIDRLGLERISERGTSLGLRATRLHDRVRDERGPDHAPILASGTTEELARLFVGLARGHVVNTKVSTQVLQWLGENTDLSLVASAFGLDPLAHRDPDHGIRLANKTGSDRELRADAGVIAGENGAFAYAVTVQFDDRHLGSRLRVIEAMRAVGTNLLEAIA